jgi:microcystin-dependent protein
MVYFPTHSLIDYATHPMAGGGTYTAHPNERLQIFYPSAGKNNASQYGWVAGYPVLLWIQNSGFDGGQALASIVEQSALHPVLDAGIAVIVCTVVPAGTRYRDQGLPTVSGAQYPDVPGDGLMFPPNFQSGTSTYNKWKDPAYTNALKSTIRAIQWVKQNAVTYKVDSSKIAVSGRSGGSFPALFCGMGIDWASFGDGADQFRSGISSQVSAVYVQQSLFHWGSFYHGSIDSNDDGIPDGPITGGILPYADPSATATDGWKRTDDLTLPPVQLKGYCSPVSFGFGENLYSGVQAKAASTPIYLHSTDALGSTEFGGIDLTETPPDLSPVLSFPNNQQDEQIGIDSGFSDLLLKRIHDGWQVAMYWRTLLDLDESFHSVNSRISFPSGKEPTQNEVPYRQVASTNEAAYQAAATWLYETLGPPPAFEPGGDFETVVAGLRSTIGGAGTSEFPSLEEITSADYLRASVENRQPQSLDTRTETLRTSLVGESGPYGVIDLLNVLPNFFVLTDGQNLTYMVGDLDMSNPELGQNNRIQNLRDAEQAGDAITKGQLDAQLGRIAAGALQYGPSSDPNVLERSGAHAMQADLDAGTRKAVNLGVADGATEVSDAVNRGYVISSFTLSDSFFQSLTQSGANPRTATLDMGGNAITNLASANPSTEPNHLANVILFQQGLAATGIVGLTEPAGLIRPWACLASSAINAPPDGYLFCDGASYSTDEPQYALLFACLGNRFKYSTDSATTFRVPDLRGRVVCGMDDMAGAPFANRITASWAHFTNGNMSPPVDGPGITRTNTPYASNLPGGVSADPNSSERARILPTTLPTHTHTVTNARWYNPDNTGTAHIPGNHPPNTGTYNQWRDTPVSPVPVTSNQGSTAPHTNIQPTMSLVWIISLG